MCEHRVLHEGDGVAPTVTRCPVHSRTAAGGEVWTWAPTPSPARCPCAGGDRFVVARASASPRWLTDADVVVADRQPPQCAAEAAARQLARLPGCALVFVPLTGEGVVLGGRAGVFLVPRPEPELCAVCLYPWLALGGRLADLATY